MLESHCRNWPQMAFAIFYAQRLRTWGKMGRVVEYKLLFLLLPGLLVRPCRSDVPVVEASLDETGLVVWHKDEDRKLAEQRWPRDLRLGELLGDQLNRRENRHS